MLVLYNPPSSRQRKPILPMSLLALGAQLEGEREYEIVDGNLVGDSFSLLDRKIEEGKLELLAVTVMPGPQLNEAVPLCRRLKERHPNLTVIWGGYFPSQHHEACLRSGYVDYVVRGCGELAFRELVDALIEGREVTEIAGLAFVDGESGAIVANGSTGIPDPQELPDYPYHRIETRRYLRPTFMGERTISHHSSYGCPFQCGFCSVATLSQGVWKAQSAERVAAIVQGLVERYGADSVEFHDNSFFIDEGRVGELAERITPLSIGWWAEARIDRLADYDDRTWESMQASGLKMVFMGAETGADETLAKMNKGGSSSTAKTLLVAEKMKRYGITPEFSFVLGNPPIPARTSNRRSRSSAASRRSTRKRRSSCTCTRRFRWRGSCTPMRSRRGSASRRLWRSETDSDWRDFSQRRNLRVPWLNPALRRRVRDFEAVLNARFPTVTDTRLRGVYRFLLRLASGWRYRLGFYSLPLELKVLQKLIAYQRPETSGL